MNTTKEMIDYVAASLTGTGFSGEIMNDWTPNIVYASMGLFGRLRPVKSYQEYFLGKDPMFEAKGQSEFSSTVMRLSDPKAVIAFDRLVKDFNSALPMIIADENNGAVQFFLKRANKLKEQLP
ncbi:hypothetical protein HYU45_01015 [Candidatus Daviesbacteria bacterium]|nr:hypothetical protein [Candidatus Daviesbacteria bacterium]